METPGSWASNDPRSSSDEGCDKDQGDQNLQALLLQELKKVKTRLGCSGDQSGGHVGTNIIKKNYQKLSSCKSYVHSSRKSSKVELYSESSSDEEELPSLTVPRSETCMQKEVGRG